MNECYMYYAHGPWAGSGQVLGRDAALESNRKTDDGEREGNYYECLRMYEVPTSCVVVGVGGIVPASCASKLGLPVP